MEQDSERDPEQTRREFGDWLHACLEKRGYVLTPRGGGQSRFAEDSGLGRSTVGRILGGKGATDTEVLKAIATTLGVPYGEVLVRAGITTWEELAAVRSPTPAAATGRYLTAEQAADGLGFVEGVEPERSVFIASTNALQSQHQARTGGVNRAAGT
ncbi:helix-turn-helix domain-containing protein [Streptomyces sp. NBC_00343]|uniref:helix-turn-helix domain-containing protein n=1 Tax=Streptomyces sp. NBC_00343 TaxID=2975719 RepID=UPI002E2DD76E|nr:helix-turn-helix transcriptional regulator [Streptomyces sp. NBC_00343]